MFLLLVKLLTSMPLQMELYESANMALSGFQDHNTMPKYHLLLP